MPPSSRVHALAFTMAARYDGGIGCVNAGAEAWRSALGWGCVTEGGGDGRSTPQAHRRGSEARALTTRGLADGRWKAPSRVQVQGLRDGMGLHGQRRVGDPADESPPGVVQ